MTQENEYAIINNISKEITHTVVAVNCNNALMLCGITPSTYIGYNTKYFAESNARVESNSSDAKSLQPLYVAKLIDNMLISLIEAGTHTVSDYVVNDKIEAAMERRKAMKNETGAD